MNIAYNSISGRFEAQFSTDFAGDLAAVKGAGFRTDGPPTWTWWTVKLKALDKLRENKPISGLSISEDAYAQYTRLAEMEAKNEEARKQFAPIKEKQVKAKKERRKQELEEKKYTTLTIPDVAGRGFPRIQKEDLPPKPPFVSELPAPKPHLGPWCIVCQAPVYPYELENPPTCLWCEKQLDKDSIL